MARHDRNGFGARNNQIEEFPVKNVQNTCGREQVAESPVHVSLLRSLHIGHWPTMGPIYLIHCRRASAPSQRKGSTRRRAGEKGWTTMASFKPFEPKQTNSTHTFRRSNRSLSGHSTLISCNWMHAVTTCVSYCLSCCFWLDGSNSNESNGTNS